MGETKNRHVCVKRGRVFLADIARISGNEGLPPDEVLKQTRSPSSGSESEELASVHRHGSPEHRPDAASHVSSSRLQSTPERPEHRRSSADGTPSSRGDRSVNERSRVDQSLQEQSGSEISIQSEEEDAPPLPWSSVPPPGAVRTGGSRDSEDGDWAARDSDESDEVKLRSKGSLGKTRPVSDSAALSGEDHHKHDKEKRRSMFGFLKKSKKEKGEKEHHKEHKEHKKL